MGAVEHPDYYNTGKIEVIDFIQDQNLGFCLGNVIKYVTRAGKKDPDKAVEDLEKAKWYLDRHIQSLKRQNSVADVPSYYPVEAKNQKLPYIREKEG